MTKNDNNTPLSLDDLARMVKEGFEQTATKEDMTALRGELAGMKAEIAGMSRELIQISQRLHKIENTLPTKLERRIRSIEEALNL